MGAYTSGKTARIAADDILEHLADAPMLDDPFQAYPHPTGDDVNASRRLRFVGETDKLGLQGVRTIMWYLQTNKIPPHFRNPPGYSTIATNVRAMRGGTLPTFRPVGELSAEELIERGIIFAGNPETVYQQIKRFSDRVGGLGNLIIMGQGGELSHAETVSNLTLFSREVYPRLRELEGTV